MIDFNIKLKKKGLHNSQHYRDLQAIKAKAFFDLPHEERPRVYVGRKMMEMELPGKRKRGRPKKRFLDFVKDMGEVGAKETDVEERFGE